MEDGISGFRSEDDFRNLKIGIVGLGLIGGSLAKAFKNEGLNVFGYDRNQETIKRAKDELAVNDCSSLPNLIFDCDVVFVALYPDGIIQFITENKDNFKKGAIVIDCSGIKGEVCEKLYKQNFKEFTFIGGHPMAGTEKSGFEAAFGELFKNASFILTPQDGKNEENSETVEFLKKLIKKAGFSRIVVTMPTHHDRMIAFTSQIPHALACSYVLSPCISEHVGFSAGSYRDVSRVAHINPELWAQLFIDNKEALCSEIDILVDNLLAIRKATDTEAKEELVELLSKARSAKDMADNLD